ncbi:unnamed protein product [Pylaiella littoralis]
MKMPSAASRSSGGRKTAHHQNVQGQPEREELRRAVAEDEEGELFLEESASALLLLHSRFFGGTSREEDIVCSLCVLCREAGWMGSPLKACPDLDPLVLANMVVAQLSGSRRGDARTRHNTTSNSLEREHLPHCDGNFSFEAFYRILSQVASLVYPLERRAMYRLLMEGVLPLAADSEPRRWLPRPEILYGRPALAALRTQRDALRQLYCTYDSIARAQTGTSGVDRSLFLKMLTDLGVSPASISEQIATSIFDDVVRNGLPDTRPFISLKLQQSRRADTGGGNFTETGGHGGSHSPSRKPRGDRLCWSLFLEAMAALAVGAVKDGRGTAAQRGRRNHQPISNPNHWDRTDRGCDNRGLEVDMHEVGLISPAESHVAQRRGSAARRGEYSRSFDGDSERTPQEMSAERVLRKVKRGTREVALAGAHATAEPPSERDRPPTNGRDFYHDSRRDFELMPTLPEQARSPLRSRAPPSLQQQTPRAQQGGDTKSTPPLSTSRPLNPLPPRKAVLTAAERNCTLTVDHFVDSEPRAILHADELEQGKTERRLIEHQRTAKKATTRAASRSEWKYRPVEFPPPDSRRNYYGASDKRSSLHAEHCLARDADETKDRRANGVAAPSIAADGGRRLDVIDHTAAAVERGELNESPSSQMDIFQPRKGRVLAVAKSSGHIQTTTLACSVSGTSRHSVRLSQHDPVGFSTRQGTPAARNTAAAANSQPVATAEVCYSSKEFDSIGAGMLSPAPCHGGSPSAISSSAVPLEASEALGGPPSRRALVVDLGLPSPQPSQGLQAQAADEHTGLCVGSSLHPCQARRATAWGGGMIGGIEASLGRDGRENKVPGLGGGDENVAQRQDCRGRGESATGWMSHADHFTLDCEAAGCTPALYEELLEPRVVTVYSRHREELLAFFQRYRVVRPDGIRLSVRRDQDTNGCIDDSGIWRFVNDFPVLRRWAQGDSILRLLVRASCGRGWQHCCGEEETARRHPSGLTYYGFLEVLTRMAYATHGQRPLHRKLLDLIRALKVDDPTGNNLESHPGARLSSK